MRLEELADIGEEAARSAGSILSQHFEDYRELPVTAKSSPGDLVSIADREAERAIIETIGRHRPRDSILGEEAGESARGSSGTRWIVDPLDGTANFLTGNPHWCVSIGIEQDGRGVVGVVFDPLRDELFMAMAEEPITLNRRVIRRSPARALPVAIVATGFSYDAARRAAQAQIISTLVGTVADIRRGGAAALDLAWTAVGRLDAFYEYDLSPWDVAAGKVLCDRAGLSTRMLKPTNRLPEGLLVCEQRLIDDLYALVTPST